MFRKGALVLSVLLVAGCQPIESGTADEGAARRYGELVFRPCTLSSGAASKNWEALCTTMAVAEDPAQPEGRQIDVNIAWVPLDEGQEGTPDPVFFLAGGPGQAATEVAAAVLPALDDVHKQRDLFFIDQRGTGKSNPLTCVDSEGKELAFAASDATSAEAIRSYAEQCLVELGKKADTRFYTTSHAVDDLEAVRRALGVDTVNLIGGSYGTRVGQYYAARYPQHTRSLVLDGLVPNDLVVGAEFANTFQRAIEAQSALCRDDAACAARFPVDTVTQLRQVVAELKASPRTVGFRNPRTGQWQEQVLPADAVTGLAFVFSYVPEMSALLPIVLDEAAQGRYQALASLSELANRSMDGQINRGMQWSVICTEDVARRDTAAPAAETLLGPELAALFYAACPVWPTHAPVAEAMAPLSTDVPALLLSGELDPVTPPLYGEAVAVHLPNSRHLVARGRGHGTLSAGCMPDVVAQFIERADAKSLDVQCLEALRPVPPFTSFNGWEP